MSSQGPPAWSSCWVFFVSLLLLSCLRAICPATPPSPSPHLPCDVTFYSPYLLSLRPLPSCSPCMHLQRAVWVGTTLEGGEPGYSVLVQVGVAARGRPFPGQRQ